MASMVLSCATLLCVLLLRYCSMANITTGSSLSATGDNSSSWVSPSGEFAFGFHQLNDPDLFLLAIWYKKIPDTIVWHANNESNHNPVGPVPRGSTLELTEAGLELKDSTGNTKWYAKPNTKVSAGDMLDTGNFVLTADSSGSGSAYAWESFKNPTDTILPSQTLGSGSMLFSKLTETDFSRGRFRLQFSDGNLVLYPVGWPTDEDYRSYYNSNTGSSSESGSQLVFNVSENNVIYIEKNNSEIAKLPDWDSPVIRKQQSYYRATLDFDGVFRLYASERNSAVQRWQPLQFIPKNICTFTGRLDDAREIGSGSCGFNSYCQIIDPTSGKPSCECPNNFVFVDPKNKFRGCKPNFRQSCEPDDGSRNPEELFYLDELSVSVNWPLGDYDKLRYNESECKKSCLHDCFCAVVVFDGNEACWKKKLPLANGIRMTKVQEAFTKAFFKVRKGEFSSRNRSREKSSLLGAFLLGGSAFVNLVLLLLVIFLVVFVRHNRKDHGKDFKPSGFPETNLRSFTYQELNEATDGFKEELGRGSFGIVYKGVLTTGLRNVIAVKKLDKLAQEREREFRTEMNAIGATHHRNLVQLIGFCDQGINRLLVYEFMSNGTLANFLFSFPRPAWNLRVRISLEIARGLVYLHEECNVPIIHCDIKPQNILLDEYFVAKISDFGLSKLLLSDQSRTRTMIRGTRGYVAPEWFKNIPTCVCQGGCL